MREWMALGAAALMLAGCVAPRSGEGPAGPIAIEGDSIRYETGPCFGVCPVYQVTVRPDGSGVFNGIRFTAVTGERAFRVSRADYAAFAATLAPYRPASGTVLYTPANPKNCAEQATDLPTVDVTWTRAIGDSQALSFYFGCDMEKNHVMGEALGSAPDRLPPLEALIGPRP